MFHLGDTYESDKFAEPTKFSYINRIKLHLVTGDAVGNANTKAAACIKDRCQFIFDDQVRHLEPAEAWGIVPIHIWRRFRYVRYFYAKGQSRKQEFGEQAEQVYCPQYLGPLKHRVSGAAEPQEKPYHSFVLGVRGFIQELFDYQQPLFLRLYWCRKCARILPNWIVIAQPPPRELSNLRYRDLLADKGKKLVEIQAKQECEINAPKQTLVKAARGSIGLPLIRSRPKKKTRPPLRGQLRLLRQILQ